MKSIGHRCVPYILQPCICICTYCVLAFYDEIWFKIIWTFNIHEKKMIELNAYLYGCSLPQRTNWHYRIISSMTRWMVHVWEIYGPPTCTACSSDEQHQRTQSVEATQRHRCASAHMQINSWTTRGGWVVKTNYPLNARLFSSYWSSAGGAHYLVQGLRDVAREITVMPQVIHGRNYDSFGENIKSLGDETLFRWTTLSEARIFSNVLVDA